MTLLEKYIMQRTSQMFLAALLPVLAIIWTIQVLQRINLVTDTGQSMGSFATLATMLLPTLIPVVLPFALVIGITQTMTAMNNDSELAIIDAAGSPRSILFRPVLILAVVLGAFSFVVTNFIEPPARSTARQMVATAYADLLSSVIEEKTFRTIQDGLYVQIDARQGRVLRGLFVADRRDPNFDLIYYAKEGAIDAGGTSLTMRDGEVQQKTPDGKVSIVKFMSYAFDLSTMSESSKTEQTFAASDSSLAFLLSPDVESDSYKKSPGNFRSELHRRLSDWMFPVVFALISLVIAADARSHREARMHPMVAALITAFMLRWLGFYFTNQVKQNAAFIPFVYAIPVLSGAIAMYLLATGRKLRLPSALADGLGKLRRSVVKRFTSDKGGASA
ncbi:MULTISPECIES: LPS export ABC transporter permease LptF [Rhizobium/Agrobacterium group]|jgi:lipopolysaccharide export system permease protein|uniref:LPS export ABC transporter permease LptF n=1 Tax=Rhizobium/Agrobacterium group TaxID=227290 RepID=UPI0017875A83|nr:MULTISPECIES: LPS export ABC transporter permease LptF [Rhizobium/Agrobacterium group]MBD9386505.1 LPS export ABC transporter permease LptF [Agrobacterium sp. AGB01]MDO5895005.1 LPS export ABC transporter permease LptF [Agrobacterium sp. Azo12]